MIYIFQLFTVITNYLLTAFRADNLSLGILNLLFFVLHWLTKKLICHKVSIGSSKIKAVRKLKNTIVLLLSFPLSKLDECTCRVLWPFVWFLSKIGFDPVLDGQPPTSKNLGLASYPFWSIALSNLLQPHSL